MRYLRLILLLSLFYPINIFSQNKGSLPENKLSFFPSEKVFTPLKASIFESRIGVTKQIDKKYLRLDIGASADLAGLKVKNTLYSAGIDFFTFSNLRSEENFKFPVDAIDYLFGINFNIKRSIKENLDFSSRLRISHISSHFEDGHIYERTDTIFSPVTYSREFIDLAGILDFRLADKLNFRNLIAFNYLFHSIPGSFGKLSVQYGLEFNYAPFEIASLYISNDLRYVKVNDRGNYNESLETGIRVGKYNSRAIRVYFAYYDGQDYKGQYFAGHLNYKAIGFTAEL